MFDLFAEGIEGLYLNVIDAYAGKAPFWKEFAMRDSSETIY